MEIFGLLFLFFLFTMSQGRDTGRIYKRIKIVGAGLCLVQAGLFFMMLAFDLKPFLIGFFVIVALVLLWLSRKD